MRDGRVSPLAASARVDVGAAGTMNGMNAFGIALLLLLAPQKPSPAEAEKLVARYFEAEAKERSDILARIALLDPLTPDAAKSWASKLLHRASRGGKSPSKARNYLYDEKEKRGLYLLGGKKPGNGGIFFGLHGGGVGEGDAGSAQGSWNGVVSGQGWLAVFPEVLEKTEAAWGDEPTERFVLDLLETMKRTFKIDTNRIYLGGHSMGGYGAWTIGGRHADLFAGLVAFAGAATPYLEGQKVVGIQDGLCPNLRTGPIYIYHSRDDPQVGYEANEFAAAELGRLSREHGGYEHVLELVDGRGHSFPNPTPAIEWLEKKARDPRPKKIVWQPFRRWKRMFYWLWWETPKIGTTLVAEITAPNVFDVKGPEPIEGLSILLDERNADLDKELVVKVNGREAFRGKVARCLDAMLLTAAERSDREMLFVARVRL